MTDQVHAPEKASSEKTAMILFGCLYILLVIGYFYFVFNAERIMRPKPAQAVLSMPAPPSGLFF